MAAAMVKAFDPPAGVRVRVPFDAFSLCPAAAKACAAKGFTFFSVAGRNRSSTTGEGKRERERERRRGIARLMPGLIRHGGRGVRMGRPRGQAAELRIARRDGHLSRIGRVRLVASKRPRGPWKKCVAVVTDEAGLRPRQVVAIYEMRWLIEVLFKEPRRDLGLGDYQTIAEEGALRHLHACCPAHQMLTHQSLARLGAKARKPSKQVTLPPMSGRLRTLRTRIAEGHIERPVKGPEQENLRRPIRDCLLAA
jgi:hypothetical protein